MLTRVYLIDEEWDLAWQTLTEVEDKINYYYGRPLDLEVAQASQDSTPEKSIPIFIKYARQYINNRGRDNYNSAASLLAIVQRLYDNLGEFEIWEILIAEIRHEFKQLPALRDELNKAGL